MNSGSDNCPTWSANTTTSATCRGPVELFMLAILSGISKRVGVYGLGGILVGIGAAGCSRGTLIKGGAPPLSPAGVNGSRPAALSRTVTGAPALSRAVAGVNGSVPDAGACCLGILIGGKGGSTSVGRTAASAPGPVRPCTSPVTAAVLEPPEASTNRPRLFDP